MGLLIDLSKILFSTTDLFFHMSPWYISSPHTNLQIPRGPIINIHLAPPFCWGVLCIFLGSCSHLKLLTLREKMCRQPQGGESLGLESTGELRGTCNERLGKSKSYALRKCGQLTERSTLKG